MGKMVEHAESKDKRSPLYAIGAVLIILGLVFVLVFGFLQPPHSCPLQPPGSPGCVIPADLFAIGAAYFGVSLTAVGVASLIVAKFLGAPKQNRR